MKVLHRLSELFDFYGPGRGEETAEGAGGTTPRHEELELSSPRYSSRFLVNAYEEAAKASYRLWTETVGRVTGQLTERYTPDVEEGKTIEEKQRAILELRRLLKDRERLMLTLEHQLRELLDSVGIVETQGAQLQEILSARKSEAELQTIVVNAFPPDRLSELSGTIAAVIAGAGGASYGFTAGSHVGLIVASVFWGFSGALLVVTLLWRAEHQREWRTEWHSRLGKL